MKFTLSPVLAAAAAAVLTASTSTAQISAYTADFENIVLTDPAALGNAGWQVFGNVFDSTGQNYLYGYGPFVAPNGGPAFSGVESGQGGVQQGANQLSVYNDYNNVDHNVGNLIESNVFQEQIVGPGDVGKTFRFTFDAKLGNLSAPSTAQAFIKVIDNNTFQLSDIQVVNTTNLPTTWGTFSIEATIGAGQVGHFFQIGFSNVASNFVSSGVFYDNVDLAEVLPPPGNAYCFGDGSGTTCPCGNPGAAGEGCANGTGSGAILGVSGSVSIGAGDAVLEGSQLPNNQPVLFFQGDNAVNGGAGILFGDGLRCAGGNVIRLQVRTANASGLASTTVNVSSKGAVSMGDTKRYQAWYRDPAGSPCGNAFNLSNGNEITWSM